MIFKNKKKNKIGSSVLSFIIIINLILSAMTSMGVSLLDNTYAFELETDEYLEVIYDPQPITLEEVQTAIDAYETEYQAILEAEGYSAVLVVQKPYWQYEVPAELMPDGYNCQFVDWDKDFDAVYYTFSDETYALELETDEYLEVIYDPQPTTLEDVQAAIDTYKAEYQTVLAAEGYSAALEVQKPHWQYEVSAELMPDGYNCQFVDRDKDFDAMYYTFSDETYELETDEYLEVIYDPQPTTLTDVQAAIDAYEAEYQTVLAAEGYSAALEVQKPHWQYEVAGELMPSGYNCQLVDWDEDFGTGYYTFFGNAVTATTRVVTTQDELESAITASAASGDIIDVQANITLTYNYTAALNGTAGIRANLYAGIIIPENKSITITSSNGSKLIRNNTSTVLYNYRHIAVNGNLILKDIELTGNDIGGGIQLMAGSNGHIGGALTLDSGAKIVNCKSPFYAGGIQVEAAAKLTVNDGAEISNCVSDLGGGVRALGDNLDKATVIMNGGTISNNQTSGNGGGIYVASAEFTMDGGTITGNQSQSPGGGVYVSATTGALPTSFIMNGGTISNNIMYNSASPYGGGGVIVYGSVVKVTFEMKGGKIIDNICHAAGGGGGVFVLGDFAKFTMSAADLDEAPVINNNTAVNGNGGGVYVATTADNALTVNGGLITGNTAALDGGGIYTVKTEGVSGYSNINVSTDVEFSDNVSQQYYVPPDAATVSAYGLWLTIDNDTSSRGSDNNPISRVEPVNNDDINVKTHTVTFYIDGVEVSTPAKQTVPQYCRAVEPLAISGVVGWYKTAADANAAASDTIYSTNKWSFISDIVKGNTNLYGATITITTCDLNIRKVDGAKVEEGAYLNEEEYCLENAEFELYMCICEDPTHTNAADHQNASCWDLSATAITDSDGLVTFVNFYSRTYLLVETKAPAGYQLPNGKWILEVDAEDETIDLAGTINNPPAMVVPAEDDEDAAILVTNMKPYTLPAAGGGGNFWYAVLGGVLILGGALLMLGYSRLRDKSLSGKNSLHEYARVAVSHREVSRE